MNIISADYNDLESCIALAKYLEDKYGIKQVVFKHPSRDNYNITFKSRTDRYKPEWVVWQSSSVQQ